MTLLYGFRCCAWYLASADAAATVAAKAAVAVATAAQHKRSTDCQGVKVCKTGNYSSIAAGNMPVLLLLLLLCIRSRNKV
jgi:hypothetical protein